MYIIYILCILIWLLIKTEYIYIPIYEIIVSDRHYSDFV